MSQFDVKMTELADSIKAKNGNVTGKLSIQAMIDAVGEIEPLPSGITVTAADVLASAWFVDNTGTLQQGSIQTVTAQLNGNVFTVAEGYIADPIELTVAEAGDVTVTDNVVNIPTGYISTPRTATVPVAQEPSVSGNVVTLYKGYQSEQKTITVEVPDGYADVSGVTATPNDVLMTARFVDSNGELQEGTIQPVTAHLTDNVFEVEEGFISNTTLTVPEAAAPTINGNEITIHKGYNPQEQTVAVGTSGDCNIQFGYWTEEGKFQEVDLSGDAPVDKGEPITVDAVMFDTGKDSPDYGKDSPDYGTGMEFYECYSVNAGTSGGAGMSIIHTTSANTGANIDWIPEDATATGADRVWLVNQNVETGPGYFEDVRYKIFYATEADGFGSYDDIVSGDTYTWAGRWVVARCNSSMAVPDSSYLLGPLYPYETLFGGFTDPELSEDDLFGTTFRWFAYSNPGAEDYFDVVSKEPVEAGEATPTWSGYKMVWSDGQAGDDIIVSGAHESELNGEYTADTHPYSDVTAYKKDGTGPNGCAVWISYGGFDGSPAWILWEDEVSMHFYKNESAGKNASISEICAGPWISDWGGTSTIPTFISSGSPAGWVKTDELVEGLEIKGYTPEVGKVYASDSTINGNMYPAEIPSGSGDSSGGSSSGGSSSGIGHTDNITAPSDDGSKVILLLGSPSAPSGSAKGIHIYRWDSAASAEQKAWRSGSKILYQDDLDYDGVMECVTMMDEDDGSGFHGYGSINPWECTWEDDEYDDIVCIAWSMK